MPLGMEVGLSSADVVLDGDPAPRQNGSGAPNFHHMSIPAKRLHGSGRHMPLGTEVGLGPDDIV